MKNEKYVLAMYDIRGKQEFIFKSNRLKEIAGASFLIRDCFRDYLFPAAKELAKKGIYNEMDSFASEKFEEHMQEGYLGEVVYEGGGNILLLYKNEDIFKKVTYEFTKKLMIEIGTLRVLGTCVEIEDFSDFEDDRKRLYAKHRENEKKESNIAPLATLPIVQVDRRTSKPFVTKMKITQEGKQEVWENVTKENKVKYEKYKQECRIGEMGNVILDDIVSNKGEDSLLAIIYIDGNNMGAQIEALFKNGQVDKSYNESITKLRNFSEFIQEEYIKKRIIDIDDVLKKKYNEEIKRRLVVSAGDEINIICNAHDAYECVKAYLSNLPEKCSSCAGIAIFHSHAPYAEVYQIAEECCETGKTWMKSYEKDGKSLEASLMDFQYCRAAIGVSLDEMRKLDEELSTSRPWLVKIKGEHKERIAGKVLDIEVIENMKAVLNAFGRSNIKGLLSAAKAGTVELELEWKRMKAHMTTSDKKNLEELEEKIKLDMEMKRKLIYDMVSVYDVWFVEEKETEK